MTMRRGRSGSSSPFRALAHHQQAASSNSSNSSSLIRSFDVETNPARPVKPSPLAASTIRDMPQDLVDRIRAFPLFSSAPEDFLVAIGSHLKPQIHAANDHIVAEGDDAKAMYWLVRGVVAVTSRDGEALYAELKPGAFFGEIGVLMDMPRTATIVARTKCLLLVLKKEDLQLVMPKFPAMETAIRQEAQERLTLLKKQRRDRGASLKSSEGRTTVPGEVATGESGAIRDGAVLNSKKRKSPSPGVVDEPVAGSVLGSGLVSIRKTLKELPLFSTLPPDVLHFLGLSAQPKTYPPFSDIIRQGTPGNEIYFIVQGEAEVVHEQKDDEPRGSRSIPPRPRLRAGQYFGEVASLGLSRGRTATVRSITVVECLMIPGETLDDLWRRSPPDIRSQVERTARLRLNSQDEDEDMADADMKKPISEPPTPTSSVHGPLPDLTFTTPSNNGSPGEEDTIERKDPDPFLSVDMENLRNRRRHSLTPPTSESTRGRRPSLIDLTPIRFSSSSSSEVDIPAKRPKFAAQPRSLTAPSLSDAILVRIFEHFDVGELIRLRAVSRHWREILTTSPDVCKHVDLSMYNRFVSDQTITRVLAPFIGNRAVSMDLNNCFHVTDEGFSVLWHQCGKNIKNWSMRSVWDVSAHQILEMSENAKDLEEVDWSNCRKVGDNLLGRVVGWVIADSPTLKKSALAHKPDDKQPSPGTVIGCPKLKRLDLSYCKHITDRSMAHLAAHASSRLESLCLTRCTTITDVGFQTWTQHRFDKLTNLCLADCTYLSDNAIVALVNAAKNLTHLDLSFCCALSDTSTEVVALGLPLLRELRMAFCGSAVSDGSLESLALHLNDLQGLSVRGCVRVTGKGLDTILRGCTHLQWVDVSQCRNLDGWLHQGSIAKWGFDDRTRKPLTASRFWAPAHEGVGEIPSLAGMFPRSGWLLGRRAREPVRFIIEKGVQGLR